MRRLFLRRYARRAGGAVDFQVHIVDPVPEGLTPRRHVKDGTVLIAVTTPGFHGVIGHIEPDRRIPAGVVGELGRLFAKQAGQGAANA